MICVIMSHILLCIITNCIWLKGYIMGTCLVLFVLKWKFEGNNVFFILQFAFNHFLQQLMFFLSFPFFVFPFCDGLGSLASYFMWCLDSGWCNCRSILAQSEAIRFSWHVCGQICRHSLLFIAILGRQGTFLDVISAHTLFTFSWLSIYNFQ